MKTMELDSAQTADKITEMALLFVILSNILELNVRLWGHIIIRYDVHYITEKLRNVERIKPAISIFCTALTIFSGTYYLLKSHR